MEIVLGGSFKGYQLVKQPTTDIPEEVVMAVNKLNTYDYSYTPIWYFGHKPEGNMTKYLITCERKEKETKQVKLMTVGISKNGRNSITLESLVLSETFQKLFDKAVENIKEITYTPLTFIGFSSKSKNYYVLCQAKVPNLESYTAILIITEQGKLLDSIRLGGLGYAFTW